MKKKSNTCRVHLNPLDQQVMSPSSESLYKGIWTETSGIQYLSGDRLNSLIKKDKTHKKSLLKSRKTRDISHIKDKIKHRASVPLILPTDFNHLKALVSSPTLVGLQSTHKSCPMVCTHKDCIERIIHSPSGKEENDRKKLDLNMNKEESNKKNEIDSLEREYLGNPSGMQDIESLNNWFKLMTKSCRTDEETEIIYSLCSKELIRQVTVHCTLRGKLLKGILDRQPAIFSKKLIKSEQEFQKFKKNQDELNRKVYKENQENMKKLTNKVEKMKNKLNKSEEIKSSLEESLLQYRMNFLDLQRKCYQAETLWRQKAEKYLKELNKIKNVVYVGTDKLAKFFAREDLKGVEMDSDLEELVKKCNEKIPELDLMCEGIEEHQAEVLNLFQKFMKNEENIEKISGLHKNLPCYTSESIVKQSESYKKSENSKKSAEKLEKKEVMLESHFDHQQHINKNSFEPTKDLQPRLNLQQANKEFSEKLNKSDEYIKIGDDKSPIEAQTSIENHYNFTEDDDNDDEGSVENELISISNIRKSNIELEINEASSYLEESRVSIKKSECDVNPLEMIELHESVQVISVSVQTDELQLSLFKKKLEEIDEILNKANTLEAQLTIKAISSIVNQHKLDMENPENCELVKKTGTLDLETLNDDKFSQDFSKSHEDVQGFKQELLEFVNSAGTLAAKFELKKEEIEELNEQLDLKAGILRQVSEKKIKKLKKVQVDEGANKNTIKKKFTLQLEADNENWNDGYQAGFEEGKIESYLTLVENIRNNMKLKDLNSSSILQKSIQDKSVAAKRKVTKLSTKFSEFNFHVPSRTIIEKKKSNPASSILEKFLLLPLHKIKTKSTVSRKNINKILISIYNEAYSTLISEGSVSLIKVTYDEFIAKYAIKSASEKKFLEFIASIIANTDYKRSSMYLKLIGYGHLISSSSSQFSKHSVNFYISCSHFLFNSKVGIFIGTEEEDKIMIPVIRVYECIKEKLENYSDRSLMQEIFKDIEKFSQPDPKKINAGGVIEMELIMESILEKYENYAKGFVKGVGICLKALGYEGFGMVSWADVQILMRFFGRSCKEFVKDVDVDDLILYCIKSGFLHEDEIFKAFDLEQFDDISFTLSSTIETIKSQAIQLNLPTRSKPIPIETWSSHISSLSSLSIEDPEVALIGAIIIKSELTKLLSE